MWLYNLILHFPTGPNFNTNANKTGYYFKDGIVGELLVLMSLFFRYRFYLISSRLLPGNPSLGMTLKKEYPFLRVRCNPGIHPPLFEKPRVDFAAVDALNIARLHSQGIELAKWNLQPKRTQST